MMGRGGGGGGGSVGGIRIHAAQPPILQGTTTPTVQVN